MPTRLTHVVVSVQTKTFVEADAGWNSSDGVYTEIRKQTFEALYPMHAREQLNYASIDQSADWVGVTQRLPVIPDGARLIVSIEGVEEVAFNVVKALPHGIGKLRLILSEVGPIQPAP